MDPLRLLIIWIALLWTVSNFLTAFWDWHVPNCMQLFWCSLNSAVEKEIVAGTCQRDSWENQMPLASSLVSIRKDNDLASPDWSISLPILLFWIIIFIIQTHSASWLDAVATDLNSCIEFCCFILTHLLTHLQDRSFTRFIVTLLFTVIT